MEGAPVKRSGEQSHSSEDRVIFWDMGTQFPLEGPSWGRCMGLALGPWRGEVSLTDQELEDRLPPQPEGLAGAAWWEERIAACEQVFRELGLPAPLAELCARRVRSVALCPGLYQAKGHSVPQAAVACYKGYRNVLLGQGLPETAGLLLRLQVGRLFGGAVLSGQVGFGPEDPRFLPLAWEAAGRPKVCWLMGGSPRLREAAKALGWGLAQLEGGRLPRNL